MRQISPTAKCDNCPRLIVADKHTTPWYACMLPGCDQVPVRKEILHLVPPNTHAMPYRKGE